MRPSNKQRSRNKSGNLGNGNNNNSNNRRPLGNIINRVFESAGPDGKVRGTPQQIIDKYQLLARDAQLAGDRVAEQSFLQHSEHYSRLLGEAQAEQQAQQQAQRQAYERDDERREDARRDEGRRDGEPRFDGQRQDGQRFDGPRFDGQRFDGQRRDDNRREEGGADRPRAEREPRPAQPAPVIASGLATFDADPYDSDSGLIETPESRAVPQPLTPEPSLEAAPPVESAPIDEPAEQPAFAAPVEVLEVAGTAEAPAPEEAPAAPKRGRPRRRAPRPEGEAAAS